MTCFLFSFLFFFFFFFSEVEAIHSMCPGVYGFSYDDGMGLVTCEPTARYLFTIGGLARCVLLRKRCLFHLG